MWPRRGPGRRAVRRVRTVRRRSGGARPARFRRPVTPAPRFPVLLWLPAALAAAFFLLPLVGLCQRAPWSSLATRLASPAIRDALWLSLQCSAAATTLSLLFGLPLAAWLAAGNSRLHTAVRVLVTLPMVLPPVVGGVALLLAYGRSGLLGSAAEPWLGFALPFTTPGVVLAETYVAMPFFVLAVEGGMRGLDPRYAEAAATLGAGPFRVFRTVTVPMLLPTLRSGLLLAWARALGEFGATITFAGNLAGTTRTMPLAVYTALETDPDAAITLSLLMVVIAAAVLFPLRRQWWPSR
ncbi:MAG: molybdate ABC transporter permease subunit [Planctomycetes bacterium]|nr:molybdate ABC transporter permease subunit [Planctomycetota bacterium]